MDKKTLEAIKAELSPDFDDYFNGPDFDESRLEFWLNKTKQVNESGDKLGEAAGADFDAKAAAVTYLIIKGEI